jgi:ABC-type sugar transport system ATPase subunit
MAGLQLANVSKRFGKNQTLEEVFLDIAQGEFFCLSGPPGAGKSTLLRIVAGLESPDDGAVFFDNDPVTKVYPRDRNVAMVFENLALYPNRTGFDNIASPLYKTRLAKSEIKKRVEDVSEVLRIRHLLDRKPGTYSGGERQRVALARAMVRRPALFLLDEPLANLDALIRLNMRAELKRLQMSLGETFLYTTHDQEEALSMGDRVAVIHSGRIHQVGPPQELYHRPQTRFVGEFLGSPGMNFLPCTYRTEGTCAYLEGEQFSLDVTALRNSVDGNAAERELLFGIRPEDIRLTPLSEGCIQAELFLSEPLGVETILYFRVGSELLRTLSPPGAKRALGEKVALDFDLENLHLFNRKTEERIF